ncbi:hypothetical protein B484DRAFT_433971 [Ochromonadaceae sp. CCMP2298]|nr:hypothetical protein B484DRAFT_433971 [Ochromonadaceae sp. CCMP2298]
MAAEDTEGGTHPYSYDREDIEASPLAKETAGRADQAVAGRTGRVQQLLTDSPDVEEHELADMLRTAETVPFYYGRYDAYRRSISEFDKEERVHNSIVDKAMELLGSALSPSVKELFADEISTRDLRVIWSALLRHGGPRSDEEGLHALESGWVKIQLQPTESMAELMLRIDRTARSFQAYDPMWHKAGAHKRLLIRSALQGHKHWETWLREITDSTRLKEDWSTLRSRLEAAAALRAESSEISSSLQGLKISGTKFGGERAAAADTETALAAAAAATTKREKKAAERALTATPAAQSLLDKARSSERKKQGGGDVEVEGKGPSYTSSITCYLCMMRGHVLKDCPLSKNFREYRSQHKVRLAAAKNTSAAAQEQDSDEEETVGLATACESFDDWLGDSASPAVETCLAVGDTKKPHIMDSGCSSSIKASDSAEDMTDFVPRVEYISLGNSAFKVKSVGRGTQGILRNVMLAPEMSYSLTSVSSLDVDGMGTFFGDGRCFVVDAATRSLIAQLIMEQQPSAIVMSGTLQRKLYHVDPVVCAAGVSERSRVTGGGGGVGMAQVRSVPPAWTIRRVLFSADSQAGSQAADLQAGSQTADSRAVSQAVLQASSEVIPYTYAKDRAQIMGSHGSVREGSTLGLNGLQKLHLRTAHAPKVHLLAGLKANAFNGAQTTYAAAKKEEIGLCESCLRGTMRQETVTASSRDITRLKPMQEVGSDPVKLSTKAFNGEWYVNFGVCYKTKLAMIYPSKSEGEQVAVMKGVKRDWCTPYGHTIRVLHTDFGSIFTSKVMARQPPCPTALPRINPALLSPLPLLITATGTPPAVLLA